MKKILAPVDTDSRSLAVARQVAELAREYDAELVLLHIADIRERPNRFFSFFTGKGAEAFDRLTKEKSELLHTWKRSLEKDYGIRVQVQVHWDQRKKGILKYADSLEVDMIALKATNFAARNVFGKQCLEYLIEESHCQVVSFLSDTTSIGQWKQVVMPVTDFVPETRIRTIAEIARSFRLKVHLIAVPAQHSNPDQDFYFLTETLKRLKPLGNIQVECRCLKQNGNHTHSFLRYAKEVGADIILTNRLFSFDYQGVSRHNRFLFDYV